MGKSEGQASRHQPRWRVTIVPLGTPEDGDGAQKRALEIVAKRYRDNLREGRRQPKG